MEPVLLLAALIIGIAAGLLSGMFGIGGGIIMVPGLLAAGLLAQFNAATAASLFAIIFLSPTGSYVHLKAKHLNWRYGLVLGASGIVGGAVGSVASNPVPQDWLEGGFAVFALFMGVQMALRDGRERKNGPPPDRKDACTPETESSVCTVANPTAVLILLGFGAGVLAGFMGVGGGLVMVPVMVLLGLGIHVAIGTSLMAIMFTAGASFATKAALLPSILPLLMTVSVPLAAGGCIAAYAGSVVAERTGSRKLSRYFSVLLFGISAYMLVKAGGLL